MGLKWRCVFGLKHLLKHNERFTFIQGSSLVGFYQIPSLCVSSASLCTSKVEPKITNIVPEKNLKQITSSQGIGDQTSEHSLRSIKYSLLGLGLSLVLVGSHLIIGYGKPVVDDEGNIVEDMFSHLPLWLQYICRGLYQVKYFTLFIQEPSRAKLLPDPVKYPFLQPPYTLVLELTDVLVHPDWTYQTGWRFKKRPGIDYLLENLAGLYEVVIFTAEHGMTVFPIIEALDEKNLISYKLVRDATHFIDGHHVKNLDKLNRDLNKVIVIDWNEESVKFHKDNLLNIGRWLGDDNDNSLIDLTSFLTTIAQNNIENVREVLKYYQTFDNPLATFRQKQKEMFELQKEEAPKLVHKTIF